MAKRRKVLLAWAITAATLGLSGRVQAAPNMALDLKSGTLSDTLRDLAGRYRVGILFTPQIVQGRKGAALTGAMSVEQALERALQGTGLIYRRLSEDRFVIVQAADEAQALPEILVVGRRSQNADIRRTLSDIQPYQIQTAQDLAAAKGDGLGAFIRERFTVDANGAVPDPSSNRSSFNIHGLSPNETLVLVDGARMPQVPVSAGAGRLSQADINGLPMLAVSRIEALTATAGGIYGPGATGGVINIVLDRDYRGADLIALQGRSQEGDAATRRIEGRIGASSASGATDLMVLLGYAAADGLRQGDRDYLTRATTARWAAKYRSVPGPPTSEAIVVRSATGANLALKPALGGQGLAGPYVWLPLDHGNLFSDGGALLAASVRTNDQAILAGNPHDRQSLTPSIRTGSAIVSLRHRFTADVEGFVDLIHIRNDAKTFSPVSVTVLSPASAVENPFRQDVRAAFVAPGLAINGHNHLTTYRLTTGLITQIRAGWKLEAAYAQGEVRTRASQRGLEPSAALTQALLTGQPLDASGQTANVFGDWSRLVETLQAHSIATSGDRRLGLRMQDATLRLAGPVGATAAGPSFLTVVGEWRRERSKPVRTVWNTAYASGQSVDPGFTQGALSLHGEIRAPLVARRARAGPLRGLELQAALRYDRSLVDLPPQSGRALQKSLSSNGMATVLGARAFPFERLMLRASYATGALPPWPEVLVASSTAPSFNTADPRRGGEHVDPAVANLSQTGPIRIGPETARTTAIGLVYNPDGAAGPRVSLDYTRIDKRHEISAKLNGDIQFFLDHEDLFPDRVTRAPLTSADAARGFTGGAITGIDASAANAGRADLRTIDLKVDQVVGLGRRASLRLDGAATWTLRFDRSDRPDRKAVSYLNALSGPLAFRGRLGVSLEQENWTLGLSGQIYGAHKDQTIDALSFGAAARRVPPQAYLDVSGSYRLDPDWLGLRAVRLVGVVANLFDKAPPGALGLNPASAYSPFGDPRGRRFEIGVRASF
ncbi:TonB-dependent receptor [Caulobacter sp. 602-1]|uniref:TonB-dependent receptor n=1 Tax=Caulobacter sp. 602-1 TaxID=2492472 RepID=UPI000F62D034|nr:TonB-dependent receptor [Caulobacter sp. 602-1]RRN63852.1 TonB-dependent receptor [Caulobacter sp. 602-1]